MTETHDIQRNIGLDFYKDWSKVDERTLVNFDVKAKVLPNYAKHIPSQGVIVEVGSFMGASAVILGLTSDEDVRVYCVDIEIKPQLPENILKYKLDGKVLILPGDSAQVAKRWQLPIDLLFLDGGHSYIQATLDSEKWAPFVKVGGVVIWHDYDYPLFDCPNVKPAVDDFMKKYPEFRKVHTEPYIYVAKKGSR